MPDPTPLRKLIITGKTDDGSHGLVATTYAPAAELDKVYAYLITHGYDVQNPEPETDAIPPSGHPGQVELRVEYVAHHDYLKAIHGDGFDLKAHVAHLKAQKGMK